MSINVLVFTYVNLRDNFLGYRGVPTKRTQAILGKIMLAFNIFIMLIVQQPTVLISTGQMHYCILLKNRKCDPIQLLCVESM